MEAVYLETSFISYLVALPSRDLIVAAHQQISHEWWNTQRYKYDCFISQLVIDEASFGDKSMIRKRLEIIQSLNALEVTDEVEQLAEVIIKNGIIPRSAMTDAAHIALASIHRMDYILTWNCKHLANASVQKRVRRVCQENGYLAPDICTPEELMGNEDDE